jgi:hypothetical protein
LTNQQNYIKFNAMKINELLLANDGTKVTELTGVLDKVYESRGKSQGVFLKDDTGRVKVALLFMSGIDVASEGKTVTIGPGTAHDNEYNGTVTREFKVYKGRVTFGNGQGAPEAPAPSATKAAFPSGKSGGYDNEGAAVGAALNNAVALALKIYEKGEFDSEWFGTPEFPTFLHRIASDIYRVGKAMKDGKLAAPATEREVNDKVTKAVEGVAEDNLGWIEKDES